MKEFLRKNWLKVAMVILLIVFFVYYFQIFYKREVIEKLNSDLGLQTRCADRAGYFYKQGGYEKDIQGFFTSYINHWNKTLEKCFIQVTTTSLDEGSMSIDLFDVFEGKHYAAYIGHQSCYPVLLAVLSKPKLCQLDSGDIWFDGNDTRSQADYHIGFQGVANGSGVGGESTQEQFLEHIQLFMTE